MVFAHDAQRRSGWQEVLEPISASGSMCGMVAVGTYFFWPAGIRVTASWKVRLPVWLPAIVSCSSMLGWARFATTAAGVPRMVTPDWDDMRVPFVWRHLGLEPYPRVSAARYGLAMRFRISCRADPGRKAAPAFILSEKAFMHDGLRRSVGETVDSRWRL
ncbi:MAG: hypothetical protein CMQ49_12605 [Gammaproteobacteria bacterium]|nr:hypothetical protein [Gammaproteobacteria bacterium]